MSVHRGTRGGEATEGNDQQQYIPTVEQDDVSSISVELVFLLVYIAEVMDR